MLGHGVLLPDCSLAVIARSMATKQSRNARGALNVLACLDDSFDFSQEPREAEIFAAIFHN
jgi:hypothetical protein